MQKHKSVGANLCGKNIQSSKNCKVILAPCSLDGGICPCTMLRGSVPKPSQYSAESTRVLCGKYNSALRKASALLPQRQARQRGRCFIAQGNIFKPLSLGPSAPPQKTGRPVTETKASTWRKSTKATARPHRQCPLPSINKRKKHWGTQKTFVILSRISKPE